jgi:hypothetical protein
MKSMRPWAPLAGLCQASRLILAPLVLQVGNIPRTLEEPQLLPFLETAGAAARCCRCAPGVRRLLPLRALPRDSWAAVESCNPVAAAPLSTCCQRNHCTHPLFDLNSSSSSSSTTTTLPNAPPLQRPLLPQARWGSWCS